MFRAGWCRSWGGSESRHRGCVSWDLPAWIQTARRQRPCSPRSARLPRRTAHSRTKRQKRAKRRALSWDELELGGAAHGVRGAAHAELAVAVLDVRRHGVQRDAEAPRDLGVAAALREQPQDIAFARGEHGELRSIANVHLVARAVGEVAGAG